MSRGTNKLFKLFTLFFGLVVLIVGFIYIWLNFIIPLYNRTAPTNAPVTVNYKESSSDNYFFTINFDKNSNLEQVESDTQSGNNPISNQIKQESTISKPSSSLEDNKSELDNRGSYNENRAAYSF